MSSEFILSLSYSNKHREIDNELAHVGRLHFVSESLEDAYNNQFVESNRKRHRISCVIGIVTLVLFIIQDLATFPEASKSFYLVIRAGICIPFFLLAFTISQMPSMRKQLPYWVVTALLLLGIGSVAIVAINYSNGHISPYEGILLTIIAAYFLVGIDFRSATMCSVLIVISYLYTLFIVYQEYSLIYYNLSFVVLTLVICAVGGYGVEKQLRINFLKNEILTILSQRDGLTGIYNRATLEYKLRKTIFASLRETQGVAFSLIDIDYFKNYNDFYGHVKGDQCIQLVAEALQRCCKRPTDFCARFGGEEFVVVWFPTKPDSVIAMVNAIQEEIKALKVAHEDSNVSEYLTVSGGMVYFDSVKEISNDDLFHIADTALYNAKNLGRNCFEIVKSDQVNNQISRV